VGIEQVHRSAQRTELLERSVRRYSARWALRQCADRHRREENSLSSVNLRKNPLRDLHRVVEHPADSARGCLSRRIARRASNILHLWEKEEG
jgi:hypothetical protein